MTLPPKFSIRIFRDFGLRARSREDLQAIQFLRTNKDISREAVLDEMRYRDVMSPDFDPDADQLLLDQEAAKAEQLWMDQQAASAAANVQDNTPGPDANPAAEASPSTLKVRTKSTYGQ